MKHKRSCVVAIAGSCWTGGLGIAITTHLGKLGSPAWGRTYCYILAAAITLTVCTTIQRHATMPRTAYRLGWEAHARHEPAQCPAEVYEMDERRA